jgi:hypothetical protein
MERCILPSVVLTFMFSVRELSAGEQSFDGCRRKYLQKQGGVRDMQANEIGDADGAYLFVLRLSGDRAQAGSTIGYEEKFSSLTLFVVAWKGVEGGVFSWDATRALVGVLIPAICKEDAMQPTEGTDTAACASLMGIFLQY